MIHVCKLDEKMLLKVFCVILFTSLRNISGTNSEQNRQVVYEKCRGPGENKHLQIKARGILKVISQANPVLAKTFSTSGASRSRRRNARHLSGAAVTAIIRIALTPKLSVWRTASVETVNNSAQTAIL